MTLDERSWFAHPMKPMRVTEAVLRRNPGCYWMERKYDGHRAMITVSQERVAVWTRDKRPLGAPKAVMEAVQSLGMPEGTVLDGEIWSSSKRGGWRADGEDPCQVTLWDVLSVGFESLAAKSIEWRMDVLRDLVGGGPGVVSVVHREEASLESLEEIRAEAEEARRTRNARSGYIHGVVLKRKGSPRRDRANRCAEHADWLKILFPGMEGWEPSSLKVA